ncbi:MAG: hypothetical protein ACI81P_002576 [Neolewinella sp.]|jgi:hypothetical protein
MRTLLFSFLSLCLLFTTCESAVRETTEAVVTDFAPAAAPEKSPAEKILDQVILAHSDGKYDAAHYQFVFRDKTYTFHNDGGNSTYTLTQKKDGSTQFDQLINGIFTRQIAGKPVTLTTKETASGTEGLNSVIYFATLPHKLSDPAVNLHHDGTIMVKGKSYDALEVNFKKEGGGVDHDDNFRYWINQETHRIDYLAYDYLTSGGGVRFRSAYNPRVVDGILFQDYINFKAPLGTALASLPEMLEKETLEKLSVIATEDVVQLD